MYVQDSKVRQLEMVQFIKDTDCVASYLSELWRLHVPALLCGCVAEVFRLISSPSDVITSPRTSGVTSQSAVSLAALVKHVPIELANKV